jgi:hypothetical protein
MVMKSKVEEIEEDGAPGLKNGERRVLREVGGQPLGK